MTQGTKERIGWALMALLGLAAGFVMSASGAGPAIVIGGWVVVLSSLVLIVAVAWIALDLIQGKD